MLRTLLLTIIGVALVLTYPAQATTDATAPVTVQSAWIPEVPPVISLLADYMPLRNHDRSREVARSAYSTKAQR